MNKKGIAVSITLLGLVIIISVATILKVTDNKKEKDYNFQVRNIIYEVKKCVQSEQCPNENITLKVLYEKTNIEEFVNPYTNEPFNENAYVTINDYEFIER